MRRRWLAVVLLAFGCGGDAANPDDAASSRLKAGEELMAVQTDGATVMLHVGTSDPDGSYRVLEPGTPLQCDADDRPSKVGRRTRLRDGALQEYGEPVERRPVRVTVMRGEHKGVSGDMERCEVRPVAK